ncbi:DUF4377 domain-containing protein [Tenacibaculum sp. TC6]|uniref:DUF4377 domain-containing protein n=1 Tax=Tenacibaculum sp. TC6 TaxID=3423223 RepID=UPI003D3612D9
MKKILYTLAFLSLLISCASHKQVAEKIIWVNSTKVPCTGVAPMQCLQIQTGEQLNPDNWSLLYDPIEGFTYQPGMLYKLKVIVQNLDSSTVPADASTQKYILKELLSKQPDVSLNLHDIWMLTHIRKEGISIDEEKERPRLEIKLADKKIVGKGVCNRFSGGIVKATDTTLIFTNHIIRTEMYCSNIAIENTFLNTLPKTATYTIANNQLYLFDKEQNEILRFKKTD